jgi:two-component system, sensor histidine kinase PdtaS
LSKAETALTLTRLLAQYKTSKKERELVELKIEKENRNLALKNRNITMFSLTGVTILSFVFTVVFVKQRNRIKKKNMALDIANKEQDALIKEIHHRVKNNLQIIGSLINLKASKVAPETSEVLYQLKSKIFSLGLIHEKLYQKQNFQNIQLDEYLMDVSKHIISSLEENVDSISLRMNSTLKVEIDVERALSCGLITNELITNSMKYAFIQDQQDREIAITLGQIGDTIFFGISDNGRSDKPLSGDFKKSFGLRFVDQLVSAKLKGDWRVESENGFHVHINFQVPFGTQKAFTQV